ncbi:translation elongation factor Ts [Mycoplasma parvum]|uniref:Elongation factor Ts n=1 Tax=Mycoplasma parvum str. Indiana TaxID=1403316 RepID=U5NG50_9MOLU|nr:translation elongation factor Ts [Mycoplasma parvum]AGX89243.1 hypothetical protein PRV_02535 [Mycoplasma parvum str. Indiana]
MVLNKKNLLVKLRKETLAPFGECAKALEEAKYDYEQAKKLLFKKSIKQSVASGLGDTDFPEGKIFKVELPKNNTISALFCIRAETDFVTNSADFKKLAEELSAILLDYLSSGQTSLDLEGFLKLISPKDQLSIEEKVSALSSITKEKIKITDLIISPQEEKDIISLAYVHHNEKLGAILSLKTGPKTDLKNIAEIRKLILHYAASSSLFLNEQEICPKWLEEEKSKLKASLLEKNPNIPNIDNIINKQIKQIVSKVTFSEQPFILDPSLSISQILFHNDLTPIWGKKIVLSS